MHGGEHEGAKHMELSQSHSAGQVAQLISECSCGFLEMKGKVLAGNSYILWLK